MNPLEKVILVWLGVSMLMVPILCAVMRIARQVHRR